MRRQTAALLLAAAFLLLARATRAEGVAADLTGECVISVRNNKKSVEKMLDNSHKTWWRGKWSGEEYLQIDLPAHSPCHGLYINWAEKVPLWTLQVEQAGEYVTVAQGGQHGFWNEYMPVPGATSLRITKAGASLRDVFAIGGIRVLGEGVPPADVQQWTPFRGKADLMAVFTHPDDELLYLGGTIPYYAGEAGKKVLVVGMRRYGSRRACELLDGLWTCGLREYPIIGAFPTLKPSMSSKLAGHLAAIIRQYQPDVVVTQDFNGEYGHAEHKIVAAAVRDSLPLAADESASAERVFSVSTNDNHADRQLAPGGPWRVKKLYVHLYPKNVIRMDWRRPLDAFDGKSAFEVAELAFDRHVSQQGKRYEVRDSGPYDCSLFGLYDSTVGPDVVRDDFFENIP